MPQSKVEVNACISLEKDSVRYAFIFLLLNPGNRFAIFIFRDYNSMCSAEVSNCTLVLVDSADSIQWLIGVDCPVYRYCIIHIRASFLMDQLMTVNKDPPAVLLRLAA